MEKYVKADKIGEGSFGVAFLARIKGSNKQVVLKEINLTKMTLKESDEARKEVAVLAQLKHCNVVSYLESFELNGNLYIVMDFCDGGDLFGRINAQHGTLFPEEQILDWFVQMCFAVKHIHDRKILHRDIKSQNIFLTKSGIIKLGDFGIAKVLNSTVELARTCIGTPYYLSPEICEAKPYNNKSDIWSLGCVLYELMTLKHAFEAPSMKALVLNIVRVLYTPPSSKYCADLRNLIATMFKKSPRERPSVTTILKKPLLQATIQNLLSKLEIAEEFNRTAIQGAKAQQAIQSVQARPLPPRPMPAIKDKQPQSPYAQRYNPAAVYGPSVACRRSRENLGKDNRKSSEVKRSVPQDKPNVRRPTSSGNSRPPSVGPVVQDPAKRRQEFNEKENERRKEILRKVDVELQKHHRLILDRQKAARISKSREDGWRSVLNSSNSEEKEPAVSVNGNVVREIGNYEHHLAQLRKLEERSQEPVSVPPSNHQRPGEDGPNPAKKCNQPLQNAGGLIGDRIQIYQEFMKRKEAAAFNRARAQGRGMPLPMNVPSPVKPVWSVVQTPYPVPSPSRPSWAVVPPPSPIPSSARPSSAFAPPATPITPPQAKQSIASTPPSDNVVPVSSSAGDQASKILDEVDEEDECITHEKILQEFPNPVPYNERPSSARVWEDEKKRQNEEYESKLRQIRLQNFNERYLREIKAAQIRGISNIFGNKNEKLKELELIRAAVRAKRFKEEHHRESEERRLQDNKLQDPEPMMRPFDALPIRAVQGKMPSPSVGMPSAVVAIGASKQEPNVPESERAQAKKSILKRVNMSFSESEDEPAKGKWAKAGVTHVLGQMELEEEGKWKNAGVTNVLDKMDLEENQPRAKEAESIDSPTFGKVPDESHKEVGGARAAANPRKQWPAQRGTVVNILSNAVICEGTRGASIAIGSAKPNTNESEQQAQAAEPEIPSDAIDGTTGDALLSDDCSSFKPESGILVEPSVTLETGKMSKDSERIEHLENDIRTPEVMEETRQDDEDKSVSEELEVARISSEVPQEAVNKDDDDQLELDGSEDVQQHAEDDVRLFLPGKGFSLKESLTSGKYDALDVKLLRTCSEPDLHKLSNSKALVMDEETRLPTKSSGDVRDEYVVFKEDAANQEMTDAVGEVVEDSYDIVLTDLSLDELDNSVAVYEDDGGLQKLLDQESESCDIDETGFESEDSDLRTLRESMANILANNVEVSDEEHTVQVTKTKKKAKKGKCSKKGKKRRSKDSSNEEAISTGKVWASSSFDDFESMKETMRSLLQSTKPSSIAAVHEKSKLPLSAVVESTAAVLESRDSRDSRETNDPATTLIPISNESVDSDFDRVDDDYFEDEGIFARLEGMRASLEDQLGCETFLKAYTTVQAFQEEDEDMEEGIKLVTRILGPDNVYLYPSILQLVMADASFSG